MMVRWRGFYVRASEFHPLPDPSRDGSREPVPELPRHHDQLSPMMRLVRGEVGEEVRQVCREVLPRRPRHAAATGDAQFDEGNHARAAARQRPHQLFRADPTRVDRPRQFDAMPSADVSDPGAPAVVDVGRNHPDRQPRNARDLLRPDGRGKPFDKVRRGPVVRPPGCNDRCPSRAIHLWIVDGLSTLKKRIRSSFVRPSTTATRSTMGRPLTGGPTILCDLTVTFIERNSAYSSLMSIAW